MAPLRLRSVQAVPRGALPDRVQEHQPQVELDKHGDKVLSSDPATLCFPSISVTTVMTDIVLTVILGTLKY